MSENEFKGLAARYNSLSTVVDPLDREIARLGGKPTFRQRIRMHQAREFMKNMGDAVMSAMLYGGTPKVDRKRLRAKDVYHAEQMGQPLIAEWIQATSKAFKWGHKERKAFIGEWRSNLWDLQLYLSQYS